MASDFVIVSKLVARSGSSRFHGKSRLPVFTTLSCGASPIVSAETGNKPRPIESLGLVSTLTDDGPLAVFAPSNEAFQEALRGPSTICSSSKEKLKDVPSHDTSLA